MRTAIVAFLLFAALASPSLASNRSSCQSIRDASLNMIEATKEQIDNLSRLRFEDAAIVMNTGDGNAAYDAARARNETLLVLKNFLDKQIEFAGALDRCS